MASPIFAIAAIVTSVRSGWELSRLIKRRKFDKKSKCVSSNLCKARRLMRNKEYKYWREKYELANSRYDRTRPAMQCRKVCWSFA
ncbi:hypothetical protein M0657_010690 [Pyricularia oryzae]|uniref:Uncharacterized protein n=2 Tax=Pyricularia TaxID=48558 RepID=A0A6P8BM22_PYRGI|nr:uncharacterized protein PgNI_01104 [Pyricularia grisea]ELQ37012.1 hypothetical protein OOU_Y34scaffold00623g1 [Pyricularia oryzae Y34]KAI7911938.1 hypothetical protein M0657_010690 [Pyricularia oryzae]TLD17863.1 hypothetical protein PgNI_01104 [Pyricularia grisea]